MNSAFLDGEKVQVTMAALNQPHLYEIGVGFFMLNQIVQNMRFEKTVFTFEPSVCSDNVPWSIPNINGCL